MRVVVGRVGRAQGLRGEVAVEVRTDAPEERFSPGAVVLLTGRAGLPDRATVAGRRWHGGRIIVRFEEITDRTAAEALTGAILEEDVDVTDTSDDEYHDLALIGLSVELVGGGLVGRVHEVLHLPGQDVLAVQRPGLPDVLVPFVRQIVREVDLDGQRLVADLPGGLTELQ